MTTGQITISLHYSYTERAPSKTAFNTTKPHYDLLTDPQINQQSMKWSSEDEKLLVLLHQRAKTFHQEQICTSEALSESSFEGDMNWFHENSKQIMNRQTPAVDGDFCLKW